MKKALFLSVVLAVATALSGVAIGAARVGTWNTMRLGSGDQKSFQSLAAIAANVDVLAVQEVMNEEGILSFKAALEQRTHESWTSLCSSPVGSRSYKEQYCFLLRDSEVKYEDGAVSYLDRQHIFMREPYSARFKSVKDGTSFVLATVHIVYGQSAADRAPELKELGNYWTWLEQVYPAEPIMLVGDFNMQPNDAAFTSLRSHAIPLVTAGASTLSNKNGKFANLYDQVWVNPLARGMISGVGIVNYPQMLGIDHEKGRKIVSDHAPVFFQLGRAQLTATVLMAFPQGPAQQVGQVASSPARNESVFSKPQAPIVSAASSSTAGKVHGNKSSQIFHLASGCPSYNKISPKNLVVFASEAEAIDSGYRKAGNCQ